MLDPELELGLGDSCLTHLSCSCYSKRSLVTARGEKINWLIFVPRNEGNLRWDLGNPLKYCCHYFFCTCEKGKKHISMLVFQNFVKSQATTLQSTMNAKLSKQRFWHCHENGAHQNDSNDTSQPIGECECQVIFPLLKIRINQDKP